MHDDITTDLADRLLCIWKWQQYLAAAIAAGDEVRTAKGSIWLARHKIRLAEEAGHMPVSISA